MRSSADGSAKRDFTPVLAQVKPEAERLLALYPDARSALLPILHAFQNVEGWVSPEAIDAAGALLGLERSTVEATASFYSLFFRAPVGKYMLQPCRNLSCTLNGASEIMTYFRERLGVGPLETTEDGVFSYEEVECLAACDRAPCMQVNLEYVYDLTKEKVDELLAAMRAGTFEVPPRPQPVKPGRTWHFGPEARPRSAGAQRVPDPDDPGGMADRTGVAMLERLIQDPGPVHVRPTRERLVVERVEVLEAEIEPKLGG